MGAKGIRGAHQLILSGGAKAHAVQLGGERLESVVRSLRTTNPKNPQTETPPRVLFHHHLDRDRAGADPADLRGLLRGLRLRKLRRQLPLHGLACVRGLPRGMP